MRRQPGHTRRHGGMGTEQVQVTVCVANAFTTVSPEPELPAIVRYSVTRGSCSPGPREKPSFEVFEPLKWTFFGLCVYPTTVIRVCISWVCMGSDGLLVEGGGGQLRLEPHLESQH